MPDVIPVPQTLPDGFCPTSWQDTLDEFAASMRVSISPAFGQIIISDTTPDPQYNSYIWFKVDGNNHVVGIYSYSSKGSGGWVLAADYPYYFQDLGTADAISITTGENIAVNLDLQGRFFFVRIAATNLTTAPTFQVDIAPVTAIKKYGSTAISAGDFAADMIAILIFDGTQFQFLNPVLQIPASALTQSFESDPIPIGTEGTSGTPVAHGFGTYPKVVDAVLRCTSTDLGITALQEIDLGDFNWHFVTGDQDAGGKVIAILRDSVNLTPQWNYNGSLNQILYKTVGSTVWSAIDLTKWALVIRAYA